MKEIALPVSQEARRKKCASLGRTGTFYMLSTIALAVLAILLALGVFITVIVFEFKAPAGNLPYILVGAFAGGAILLALSAFGMNALARRHRLCELDFRERCDGEESFFVGDGTLATFGEHGIVIHGETPGREEIRVPYSEMRFFSVCTRRAPRERGEWSVVFEIPARYLAKPGQAKPGDPPALVQTDAKDRLGATLARHGLTCIGEVRTEKTGKFPVVRKFYLPNREKRKRAFLTLCLSFALCVGGVFAGVFWQITAGALLGALGVVLAGRSLFAYVRAKGLLGYCEEGLYWRDIGRADSVFLKWEEIESVALEPNNGAAVYRVQCAYGAYHFPAVAGSYEFLKERQPEKFADKA